MESRLSASVLPGSRFRILSRVSLLLLSAACLLPLAAIGQSAVSALPPPVQVVVNGYSLPSDSYTILVQDVESDVPLLSINTDRPFNPASTVKTLTTLAGLERLGPDYTWSTDIYIDGTVADGVLSGDLIIRGGGDPFLVEEHFRSMLKAVQRRGIHSIRGDVVLDGSLYDSTVWQQDVIDNQPDRAYNVMPHALLSNFQVVTFYFRPDSNGRDVVISADPPLPNLRIVNQLRQENRACSGFQRGVAFSADASSNTVTFRGTFPSRCDEYQLSRAVLDAPQYTWGLFSTLWSELGGQHDGGWRVDHTPASATPLVQWNSPPLADVIRSINKFSNNVMTRHLLLTLGLQNEAAPATVEKGIEAIRRYLDDIDVDHGELVLVNGAGLSREARLTAEMLGAVLRRGWQIPLMPEFAASLPIAGLDGTLRSRLGDPETIGTMHVKTGSLNGVNGVAGYVHARSGKNYIVVVLLNHPQADAGYGQELSDSLLRWVQQQ